MTLPEIPPSARDLLGRGEPRNREGTEVPIHRIRARPSVLTSNHQSGGKRGQVADSTPVMPVHGHKSIVII